MFLVKTPITKYCVVASLVVFTGCASLEPYIRDINIISVPQEKEIGNQFEAEIAKEMTIVQDSIINNRIDAIGKKLLQGFLRRDFDYRFHVVEDKTPNAFTIPGGIVYVHTGLINSAGDDSELAGVLGHELGHAYKRHPAKGMTREFGIDYLTKLLFKDPSTQGQLKTITLSLAKGGILSKYSRQDEYEADEIGYLLVKKTGYSTSGLLRFLRKIMILEQQTGRSVPFLASHPPTPDRIARLESFERSSPSESILNG